MAAKAEVLARKALRWLVGHADNARRGAGVTPQAAQARMATYAGKADKVGG